MRHTIEVEFSHSSDTYKELPKGFLEIIYAF